MYYYYYFLNNEPNKPKDGIKVCGEAEWWVLDFIPLGIV